MAVYAFGTINTTALIAPGLYVQIIPPQNVLINGLPTNILGQVGTAQWGPVNSAVIGATMADFARNFGALQPRKYDLGTGAACAALQGANNFRWVRVTDGTDTAASATITSSGTGLTVTSKYTGSLGNSATVSLAQGTAAGTYKATIAQPGQVTEIFDNVTQGISAVTIVPGTGYTSVPTLAFSAPTATVGPLLQAAGTASLTVLGVPTVSAGGTGYAVNDIINLPNGVQLKVATLSVTAVATVTVLNSGSLTAGSTPTNPVAQVSTSGTGTGASFTLVWCLGPVTITVPGQGYLTGATATLTGGGGTGGSATPIVSYWLTMANYINNGVSGIRGASQIITAAAGTATGVPVIATTTLSGGTDGASAVSAATLVGVDGTVRKGMYALRGTYASIGMLCDADDSTQWTNQCAFGLSEGVYMIGVTPAGDTIANATGSTGTKATAGIDCYDFKLCFGDWVYWNDTVNNIPFRLVSPQGFVAGRLANLSPQMSPLNKQLYGIVGTQRSSLNQVYAQAEIVALAQSGFEVIANPSPGGSYFSCQIGHNSSSNLVIQTDSYTRMTNYLAYTLNAGIGQFIGQLHNPTTRKQVKSTLENFFDNLVTQGLIGTNDPTLQPFQVICDNTNNPANRVALGYLQVDCRVSYWSIVEKLIANVEGGQSVLINRVSQATINA